MEYACLEWACSNNQKLLDDIHLEYQKRERYLSYIDDILRDLRDCKCGNIQEKIQTVQISRLLPFIAELETARVLGKKGFAVELLPDDFFRNCPYPDNSLKDRPSPDILIKRNGYRCIIEVTFLSSSDPVIKLIQELRDLLIQSPFRVDSVFRNRLTEPCLNFKERRVQSDLVQRSFDQFRQQFENVSTECYPAVIETDDIIFSLSLDESGKGYPGEFLCSNTVSLDFGFEYLTDRLTKKAEKRTKFPGEWKKFPYLISLVSHEDSIDSLMMRYLLYGSTCERGLGFSHLPEIQKFLEKKREEVWKEYLDNYPQKCGYWDAILEALKNGCLRTLLENYLIPNDYCSVSEPGVFLTENTMKNVSGIFFIERGNHPEFFINPFCETRIFDKTMEDI